MDIQVPDSIKFPYVSGDSPFPYFLPLYTVETTKFEEFPETFVLISGERCRWECSESTIGCEVLQCWNRPSVCIGELPDCLKFDGDGTCTKISDIKEEIQSNEDEYLSTDFGDLLGIDATVVSIDKQGYWEKTPAGVRYWNCSITSDSEVSCYSNYVVSASIGYLRTLRRG